MVRQKPRKIESYYDLYIFYVKLQKLLTFLTLRITFIRTYVMADEMIKVEEEDPGFENVAYEFLDMGKDSSSSGSEIGEESNESENEDNKESLQAKLFGSEATEQFQNQVINEAADNVPSTSSLTTSQTSWQSKMIHPVVSIPNVNVDVTQVRDVDLRKIAMMQRASNNSSYQQIVDGQAPALHPQLMFSVARSPVRRLAKLDEIKEREQLGLPIDDLIQEPSFKPYQYRRKPGRRSLKQNTPG